MSNQEFPLINYPKCSSEIISIPIDSKDFNIDYIYRIFGNDAFDKKVSIGDEKRSIKNDVYLELLIPTTDPTVFNVYSNFSIKNALNTVVGSDICVSDPDVQINDKRVWIMDRQIQVLIPPPEGVPGYISVPFKNNPSITTKLKWTASVKTESTSAYQESFVTRKTIWVYNPLTTVYLLVNHTSSGIKIYVMQSLDNASDPENNTLNAQYLSTKLILPPGWIFSTMNLAEDTYLKVVAKENAVLVRDSLGNSYQYLEPKYAPWIYENYPVPI